MIKIIGCRNDYDYERQVVFGLRSEDPLTPTEWLIHIEALSRIGAKHSTWVYDELEHLRRQHSDRDSALEKQVADLTALVALQSEQLAESQARIAKLEQIVALLIPRDRVVT